MSEEVAWPSDPLRMRRERTPDRLAIVDAATDREWTYAAFDRFVDDVAAALVDAGVEPGERVATLLHSRPLSVALPFATLRLGATLAPLNVDLDPETLTDQLDSIGATLLLCSADTETTATTAFDGAVRTIDEPSAAVSSRFSPGTDDGHKKKSPTAAGADPLEPTETALIVFTSGTTGRPKGVRLTLANLLSSATASATRLGVAPRDRWLSPLSTYHVGGLAPFVRSTLYGTTAVLQRTFDADTTSRILDRRNVTCVSLVPTMLRRLLDAGWDSGPAFRFVLLGGGPASEQLVERCLDRDVPVCPTYGATETASQVATATPGDTLADPGTVGPPLRETTVRVESNGAECDSGATGELVVEGPTVSQGYLSPEATASAFEEGAFRTGDLGVRDEAGRLRIVGRADDVIVTGGENVQPSTVVAAIEAHPAVAEAAVVGVPDDEWGERVAALVVDSADATIQSEDLRDWLRGRIPTFAVPKSIAFTRRLPRTPSGTVDRAAVREQFE